jgi:hypothetical protein
MVVTMPRKRTKNSASRKRTADDASRPEEEELEEEPRPRKNYSTLLI